MSRLVALIKSLLSAIYIPKIQVIDVVEILLIAVAVYFVMKWIKSTRAYRLLRGILFVVLFIIIATIFNMSTILWLVAKVGSVALIALVMIFQPELRKALESLGNKSFLKGIFRDTISVRGLLFSDKTIVELVHAVTEMSEVKTGALIVIEQDIHLDDFVDTGISLDADVSSQLLINIFEKNTPLHDGAVIMRGDKVLSATCYLPLSENLNISKKLGTRHRAGLGISEVSDSYTIIVSEETGVISAAYEGSLETGLSASELRERLHQFQNKKMFEKTSGLRIWKKGRDKNEENAAE